MRAVSRTKLRGELAVDGGAGPVVGPGLVPVRAEVDHGLDGEAHALLRGADGLVVLVVRDVGRAVEQAVDAVADVRAHHVALLRLGVLVDRVAEVAEQHARLDQRDGLRQALARRLDDAHRVGVARGLRADVVRLVQVAVEALVVQRDVDVQDVAVDEDALVGDAVADDLVDGRAHGLGEVAVVEWRGI